MQNEPFLILSPICTFSCVKNGLHSRLIYCINMLHFCFMGQCSFVGGASKQLTGFQPCVYKNSQIF